MKRVLLATALMVGSLGIPALALAADKAEPVLTAQTKVLFDKQADGIRAQIGQGGRYQFIKDDEKRTVEQRLNSIAAILDKHADGSRINDAEKLQIVNAQEEVNAILAQRDSKRLVCERRAPTGSHRPVNTCRTYGEIEQERRATQDLLRQTNAVKSIERGG